MNRPLRIALVHSVIYENYTAALTESAHSLGLTVGPVWFGRGPEKNGVSMLPPEMCRAEDFDGLLLPGGGDVCPERYGEENRGSAGMDPDLDAYQFAILDDFVRAGKPVLGICRGHQVINVYFGGSLIQDLPERAQHTQPAPHVDNAHRITAEPGSVLYRLYGAEFPVNSAHHQGVGRLAPGLRITARSEDGVAEGMEHETLPVLSVQFHPERMDYAHRREDTVPGGKIFDLWLSLVRENAENGGK